MIKCHRCKYHDDCSDTFTNRAQWCNGMEGEKTMAKYIVRETGYPGTLKQGIVGEYVKIVRCKDCKWWDQINDGPYGYCHACKHAFYSSSWEINIYRRYKEDWFCADGERKDDEMDDL